MKKSILNEENLTHAGLAHKNGFSPAYLLKLLKGAADLYLCACLLQLPKLVKGAAKLCTG
jgi:hypothetical protein